MVNSVALLKCPAVIVSTQRGLRPSQQPRYYTGQWWRARVTLTPLSKRASYCRRNKQAGKHECFHRCKRTHTNTFTQWTTDGCDITLRQAGSYSEMLSPAFLWRDSAIVAAATQTDHSSNFVQFEHVSPITSCMQQGANRNKTDWKLCPLY